MTRLLPERMSHDEQGQGLAEYALILALIAIIAIVALLFLGTQVEHHPQHRRRFDLGRPPRNGCREPARRAGSFRLKGAVPRLIR